MLKTVSQEVKIQRLKICQQCEFFTSKYNSCNVCGCYMPAKALFAAFKCPKDKWSTAEPGQDLINKIEEMILASWKK